MSAPPRVRLAQKQASRALRARRGRMTLRNVTRTSGPAPAINPPATLNVVADAAAAPGALALTLRGTIFSGRLIEGDRFVIDGVPFTVDEPGATIGADARVTVPLKEPVVTPIASGAAVTQFTWLAETAIPAEITAYPRNLIDGQMIVSADLQVLVAAFDCPREPREQDTVLISLNGEEAKPYVLQSVLPRLEQGWAITYMLQARCG